MSQGSSQTSRSNIDMEVRREQLYYTLGERGDLIAEQSAEVARQLRDRDVDWREVERLKGTLIELYDAIAETEAVIDHS